MQLCFFLFTEWCGLDLHQKSDYEAENQFDWQLKSTKLLNVYSAFYRSHKKKESSGVLVLFVYTLASLCCFHRNTHLKRTWYVQFPFRLAT